MEESKRLASTKLDYAQAAHLARRIFRTGTSAAPVPEEVEAARRDPANLLGRFVLVELVGRGGMGEVHRAWQEGLCRWVALKLLRPGNREVDRFVREAQAIAALEHPGIAKVYEAGEAGGRSYIAMQWIDGVSLDRVPLEIRGAVTVMRAVCEAAHHSHLRGIIHRDIKPANIMMAPDSSPLLVDFGLARTVEAPHLTSTGMAVGTPGFMAPEQALANPDAIGAETDVFALGATLYYLLTRRTPFESTNPYEGLARMLVEDAQPPSAWNRKVDRDLDTVVLRCLEKEIARRYHSAAEVAADLGRWLEGRPVTARPIRPWNRWWRAARRHPRIAAAFTAIALLVGVGAGYEASARSDLAREARLRELQDRAAHEFALGHIDAAEEAAADLRELVPSSAAGHYWRGRVRIDRYSRGRVLPPAFLCQGLLEFAPAIPDRAEDRGIKADAQRCFEQVRRAPDRLPEQLDLAEGLLALFDGRAREAATHLDRTWEAGIRELDAGLYRVEARYRSRDFAGALEALDELSKSWPKGPQQILWEGRVHHALAVAAMLQGADPLPSLQRALRCADAALVAGAAEASARVLRSQALTLEAGFRQGCGVDPEPKYLEAAEALAPVLAADAPEALLAHGELLLVQAESRKAEGKIDVDHAGEYVRVIEAFSRAVAARPDYAGGFLRRAEAWTALWLYRSQFGRAQLEDIERGHRDCEQALALDPGITLARITKLRLQRGLELSGRSSGRSPREIREDGIRELLDLAAGSPDPALLHYEAGLALFDWVEEEGMRGEEACGILRRSIDQLTQAIQVHPNYLRALLQRGTTFGALERAEADLGQDAAAGHRLALDDFARALKYQPRCAEAFRRRGSARVLHGNVLKRTGGDPVEEFRAAGADLDDAIRLNPRDANSYSWRATVRAQWGHLLRSRGGDPRELYRRALEDFDRALEQMRSAKGVWFSRGTCRRNLGVDREARGEDPLSDYRLALADYSAALELDPTLRAAHSSRGLSRLLIGSAVDRRGEDPIAEYDAAIEDLGAAMRLAPPEADDLLLRGRAHELRARAQRRLRSLDGAQDLEQALADLDGAAALASEDATIYVARGNLHVFCGRVDEARRDFTKARALDPRVARGIPPGW